MTASQPTTVASAQLQTADYVILVGYFLIMLGIGVYFYRYMKKMNDYFSGGNQIPWWLSGVSFYMTSFSAFAFVTYSALAYQYGWTAVTLFWVTIPATLVGVILFSTKWRRARIESPVEYIETRYGSGLRQLFAWQGLPVRTIDDGLKLIAIGAFLNKGLGLSYEKCVLYSGIIILAYTLMGGLWAVVITDFIQFVVMAAGVVILVLLSFHKVGWLGGFISHAPEGFFRPLHEPFGWVYLACNLLMFSLAYSSVQWALIQKYYCVPKESDARKVGYLVAGLNLIGAPLMFIPAMAARQYLPAIADTNQVYPTLCASLLPAGLLGLIIAAMFSSTMSALSGNYNVCASVLTNDIYRRLFRPKASEKELVLMGRVMTFLVGIITLWVAFRMGRQHGEKLFRSMISLFSVATAPVALPMLLGLIWRKTTNGGAVAGFLIGVSLGTLVWLYGPAEATYLGMTFKNENLMLLVTLSSTLITIVGVSYLFPPSREVVKRVGEFHDRLDIPVGELPSERLAAEKQKGGAAVFSPFKIIGVLISLIGVLLLIIVPFVGGSVALIVDLAIGGALFAGGALLAIYESVKNGKKRRAGHS